MASLRYFHLHRFSDRWHDLKQRVLTLWLNLNRVQPNFYTMLACFRKAASEYLIYCFFATKPTQHNNLTFDSLQ